MEKRIKKVEEMNGKKRVGEKGIKMGGRFGRVREKHVKKEK